MLRNPPLTVMIVNVANAATTPDDMAEIEAARCLHCVQKFNPVIPITYVRLESSEIIWWHRQGTCPVV